MLQFGKSASNVSTQNLPTSYTNTNYKVFISYVATDLSNGAVCHNTKTVSNFKIRHWDNQTMNFLAIGY